MGRRMDQILGGVAARMKKPQDEVSDTIRNTFISLVQVREQHSAAQRTSSRSRGRSQMWLRGGEVSAALRFSFAVACEFVCQVWWLRNPSCMHACGWLRVHVHPRGLWSVLAEEQRVPVRMYYRSQRLADSSLVTGRGEDGTQPLLRILASSATVQLLASLPHLLLLLLGLHHRRLLRLAVVPATTAVLLSSS
jgi:hypothetical protein